MAQKIFFVSGTDTDIGKTVVSAGLISHCIQNHIDYCYFKPLQTGGEDTDLNEIKDILGIKIIFHQSIMQYPSPLSPDQASLLDKLPEISINDVILEIKKIKNKNIIIEGAGGLLVPINSQGETWADLIQRLDCELILVAKDKLGMLNHTSLSIEYSILHNFNLKLVIINTFQNEMNFNSLQSKYPNVDFSNLKQFGNLKDICNFDFSICFQDLFKSISSDLDESTLNEDKQFCWHPYTQHKTSVKPLVAKKAQGIYIHFENNLKLVDGASSWWVNTIGHGRKEIAQAIYKQQQTLDHVLFAEVTHKPAVELSKKIISKTNQRLDKVFFSDNGSTSIEVALKIAFQSFVNRGIKTRKKFLGFHGSYHGDTFGAMSVAKSDIFHGLYKPLMFNSIWATPLTNHKSYLCPNGLGDKEERFKELENIFEKHHTELAGVIVEPLIQGAGGMLVQSVEWLQHLSILCKAYEIPLILDEVFSGMGRTGEFFAFLNAEIDPDIVCVAKGLTGGNLPLALTLTKDKYYFSFFDDHKNKALLHGHSFTANPISCAAALATLKIIENENLILRSKEIELKFKNWIAHNADELKIENPRCIGAILAFEFPDTGFNDYFTDKISHFVHLCREEGLFLRTLGNTIYFVPPLIINDQELEFCLKNISSCVRNSI